MGGPLLQEEARTLCRSPATLGLLANESPLPSGPRTHTSQWGAGLSLPHDRLSFSGVRDVGSSLTSPGRPASVSNRGQRAGVEALETRLCFLPLTCVSIILSCRFILTGKHLTFLLQRRQRSWNPLVRMDYFHVLWAAPALGGRLTITPFFPG